MIARRLVHALALLALPALGCAQAEKCPPTGACGGDLVGANDSDGDGFADKTWVVSGTCLEEIVAVPQNATLVNQPTTLDGQPPPEPEQNHWCSEMVLSANKEVKKISPWFPAIPIRDGIMKYSANGKFALLINYFEPQTVEFQRGCFESQGYVIVAEGTPTSFGSMTCSEFGEALRVRLEQEPNIDNGTVRCIADGAAGCLCAYDLLMVTGANGTFTTQGNVLSHWDRVNPGPPSRAEYCVEGSTLTLSGHDHTFLFSQPHLRTLVLSGG